MDISVVYDNIRTQLGRKLPFVVYKKSGESIIYSYLQNDTHIYSINFDNPSGFVFAPFSDRDETILIPKDKSSCYSAVISSVDNTQKMSAGETKAVKDDIDHKNTHIALVDDAIERIADGVFQKVVLSRKEEVHFSEKDPLEVFQRLVDNYPNAFVYYWYHPKIGTWLGATPETLLTIKEGVFNTMALAGTQPYTGSLDVHWGAKEVEEQLMVTDFVLNELSLKTTEIEKSETYTYKAGTLLHLRTDIKGVLSETNSGIWDIIQVLHPTPAVCGLPKKEALSFILEKEGYHRKYYTGFLGEVAISQNGTIQANLYVNLRCMELKQHKAILYIGGGITKDSIPENEWEETARKTETMKKVLH